MPSFIEGSGVLVRVVGRPTLKQCRALVFLRHCGSVETELSPVLSPLPCQQGFRTAQSRFFLRVKPCFGPFCLSFFKAECNVLAY